MEYTAGAKMPKVPTSAPSSAQSRTWVASEVWKLLLLTTGSAKLAINGAAVPEVSTVDEACRIELAGHAMTTFGALTLIPGLPLKVHVPAPNRSVTGLLAVSVALQVWPGAKPRASTVPP